MNSLRYFSPTCKKLHEETRCVVYIQDATTFHNITYDPINKNTTTTVFIIIQN